MWAKIDTQLNEKKQTNSHPRPLTTRRPDNLTFRAELKYLGDETEVLR